MLRPEPDWSIEIIRDLVGGTRIIINAFLMRQTFDGYTSVRLKVLYTKHYNNTQPNLIMHYYID